MEKEGYYSIPFPWEKIKYIIVANHDDRKEIIHFIQDSIVNASSEEKLILISKILVFDKLEEDW